MKTGNLDTFAKNAVILLMVGLFSGCEGGSEESSKANQDAAVLPEFSQSDEAVITTTEPSAPMDSAAIAESVEKSLDAILEEADAVIKRTEESLNEYNGDAVKTELGEAAESIAEESKSHVAAAGEAVEGFSEEAIEAVQETVHDGHEIVKVTPDIIREVQEALNNAGFNAGTADGKLGPRTLSALKSYQQQNELEAGKFTKETLRALNVPF
ncbi:MAG: peptidoglycan-binding protein [Nitrosomonas sp.]|nr:peptidoglycan-binding protein [Nitrosomonas sp.]